SDRHRTGGTARKRAVLPPFDHSFPEQSRSARSLRMCTGGGPVTSLRLQRRIFVPAASSACARSGIGNSEHTCSGTEHASEASPRQNSDLDFLTGCPGNQLWSWISEHGIGTECDSSSNSSSMLV